MDGAPADELLEFIHGLRFEALPESVVDQAQRCLLDLIGVGFAGRDTAMSRIARDQALEFFGGRTRQARLLFDGRRASPGGAAMAGAMTIDSLDGHDGHAEAKGHAGVTALPAVAAFADQLGTLDGRAFLTSLVLGYEVGTRAGIALHRTSPDYHASGAWNALAAAAIGARLLGLDGQRTGHALGIAEYHGPRSQMMRCIDHPTMVKDSSGWGALAGVNAAYFAEAGFTGAPAITTQGDDVASLWDDLGRRWRILEQYVKPYPVCRWAHPAIEASLAIVRDHALAGDDIESIEITTFHQAARLAHPTPATTEEAQYSLQFPVAAALAHGEVRPDMLAVERLADPRILRLSRAITTRESAEFDALFPAERWASVAITRRDGVRLESGPTQPRGDPDRPLSTDELVARFRQSVGDDRHSAAIEATIATLTEPAVDAAQLLDLILRAPGSR